LQGIVCIKNTIDQVIFFKNSAGSNTSRIRSICIEGFEAAVRTHFNQTNADTESDITCTCSSYSNEGGEEEGWSGGRTRSGEVMLAEHRFVDGRRALAQRGHAHVACRGGPEEEEHCAVSSLPLPLLVADFRLGGTGWQE
jgi:hypothetical protein